LALLLLWSGLIGCSRNGRVRPAPPSPPTPVFPGPTASSSVAVDSLGERIWVANSGTGTITQISVERDVLVKMSEVSVGLEPTCLALSPDDQTVFVTNRGSGTVSVVSARTLQVTSNISVGSEPVGCALTPLGNKLYVACSVAGTVAVIDTATRAVTKTLATTDGFFPFAVAVTSSDPAHANEKVYVTQFFAQLPAGTRPGLAGDTDQGRVGKVSVIRTSDDSPAGTVVLHPHRTGFTADRTAFGGAAAEQTYAFPNLLSAIAIRGSRGYVVSSAQSPQGPVRFDTNQQSFVSVFDTATDTEVETATINLNEAVRNESPRGVIPSTPWGLAFSPTERFGLVISAASDVAVRLGLSADGSPIATASGGGLTRIPVGKNPRGIALNRAGTRAYIHNHIDRSVTVHDLTANSVLGTVVTTAQPAAGSEQAAILRGEELFVTSQGTATGTTAPAGRMSTGGWGSCFGCHPFGWTDTVVWGFEDGPRRTSSLHSIFSSRTTDQRLLGASATRDEPEDFELSLRLVTGDPAAAGSTGLMVGVTLSDIPPLTPRANAGRSQDWTDLVTYLRRGLRSPISPFRDANVGTGRVAFALAGCTACHGGALWSSARRGYAPPPAAGAVTSGQVTAALRPVDTFLAGEVNQRNQAALGTAGFAPPSLNGFWAFPPFFHNGQAASVDEVMTRVLNTRAHRDAGLAGHLENPATRTALALFLMSIDDFSGTEVVP
jgi:YVTN family beta-propeller protein